MRLRVTDLGPVREAEIDLSKPLLILTGPNNSGKTYLSWVIYSLARTDPARVRCPPSLLEVAKELLLSPDQSVSHEAILSTFDDVARSIAKAACERLATDFGAPEDRFSESTIEIRLPDGFGSPMSRSTYVVQLEHNGQLVLESLQNAAKMTVYTHRSVAQNTSSPYFSQRPKRIKSSYADLDDVIKAQVETELAPTLMTWFFDELFHDAVAFPVERLAISLFARELAANRTELIDELISQDHGPNWREHLHQRARLYPLVIRDALQAAIKTSSATMLGPFADLADELENAILGGHLKFSDQGDLEYTLTQGASKSHLRLHESASMVKSLASLVIHLRYHACADQRLYIDEPELNLHPDNQRKIARVLAKAVNRGLKILISTHSDYIIRELNNLIMLGQDSDEAKALAKELGYDSETTLTGDLMGVYLVNEGACRSIPVEDTGFEVATIDQAAADLNRDSQQIFLRLFGE